jgi:hypothetical protein
MIKTDERFFTIDRAKFVRANNKLTVVCACTDNFTPEIPRHERAVTRQIMDNVGEKEKLDIEFEYEILERPIRKNREQVREYIDALYADNNVEIAPKIDKVLPVKFVEYFLGTPVKDRPVQIKYLKNSKDFQTTAGTIYFLKRREYTKNEVTKNYWTFTLDDGNDRVQCVYFPSEKWVKKFEKLVDRTVVCVVGVHEKRNERTNMRIMGVSFCEFVNKPAAQQNDDELPF